MPPPKKKNASGPSIPEAVRAERGTKKMVSVRLSPAALAKLDAEARRRGLSRSALIEALAAELPEAEAD